MSPRNRQSLYLRIVIKTSPVGSTRLIMQCLLLAARVLRTKATHCHRKYSVTLLPHGPLLLFPRLPVGITMGTAY